MWIMRSPNPAKRKRTWIVSPDPSHEYLELAAKRRKEIEKEEEGAEQQSENEFEDKREELMSSGQLDIQLNRSNSIARE
jgi:hypothetical protein